MARHYSFRTSRAYGDPREIGMRNRIELERFRGGRHARQCLGQRHRRLCVALLGFMEANRIESCGEVFALTKTGSQGTLTEPIDLLQHRSVSTAGETRCALIDDTEGEQLG